LVDAEIGRRLSFTEGPVNPQFVDAPECPPQPHRPIRKFVARMDAGRSP
jgi:hypothetical protein